MKSNIVNNSSDKTKMKIRLTFTQLVREKKEISKISVTELTKRAGINRGTFYTHYEDIYAVVDELWTRIANHIIVPLERENIDIEEYIEHLINFVAKEETYLRNLVFSEGSIVYARKIGTILSAKLREKFFQNEEKNKLQTSFFVSGLFALLVIYLRGQLTPYSLDNLKEAAMIEAKNLL